MENKGQQKCGKCGNVLSKECGHRDAAADFESIVRKFGAYYADPVSAGMTPEERQKYEDAVLYATEKHKAQERDDGTPYIFHPIRVARNLREIANCRDVDMLCAAILHDTIEDSNASYDELAKRFGHRAARFVAELTADKRLPKHCRTRILLETAQRKSPEYRLIKLADRLDNLSDMNGWTAKRKQAYCENTADLLKAHTGTHKKLEQLIAQELERKGIRCHDCGRFVAGLEENVANKCRICVQDEELQKIDKNLSFEADED